MSYTVVLRLTSELPAPPVATDDDRALALAAAEGDVDAFATLYHRHAARVFTRLTRLIGPGPDREDVLQQVFLELHRALPGFRGDARLSTFLYRITVNVACDHLRRRLRRPIATDAVAIDDLIDHALSPEAQTRARAELRQVFALLERIKPDKRVAFVLVAVEGLALDEAAELVGATPDAVKQRVLHARRELVAMIERAERRPSGRNA